MAKSPRQQANLAKRWLEEEDETWLSFIRRWMAFNALYTTVRGNNPEHVAVANVITHYLNQAQAAAVLAAIEPKHITALMRKPPGDMRRLPANQNFRRNTTHAIADFRNPATTDPDRLAALMKVVYQVRSNLVHASKNPHAKRDHNLVSACIPILDAVLPVLIRAVK